MRTTSGLGTWLLLPLLGLATATVACSGSDQSEIEIVYNQATARVEVQLTGPLADGEQIFIKARRGNFGPVDCQALAAQVQPSTDFDADGAHVFGPTVDSDLTEQFFGPEWATEPTPEMLAALQHGTDSVIDVCIMNGSQIVFEQEVDLFQAWDRGHRNGVGGKADDPGSGEQQITSAQAYGERCVAELGEIPFFTKQAEGSYSTYDCLDSTPIPMTVTDAAGSVTSPTTNVNKCDNPQHIYSLCETGPRVATTINDQGTRWVLLCRKSLGGLASNKYNDIAMIGNNPFTGKTCFFQNALYQKTDGSAIPHPADKVKSTNLWSGVHGGNGSGIQCSNCHDADAFIHSPWIDGALDAQGRPVVPKMGVDPDYPIGNNEAPYALINAKGQGWTMNKSVTAPQAAACTKCHRMGDGRWTQSWIDRLDGTDTSWTSITTDAYNQPGKRYFMPTDHQFTSDAEFEASESNKAIDFIKTCRSNPGACGLTTIPTSVEGESGNGGKLRNKVTLTDTQVAQQALALLGYGAATASDSRCGSCHTLSRDGLRKWADLTSTADSTCLKSPDGGIAKTNRKTGQNVKKNKFVQVASFDVAAGARFEVTMKGTGDADLYVRRGAAPSKTEYDCRPFATGSVEACTASNLTVTGPGKFYVAIAGNVRSSTVQLDSVYTAPDPAAPTPAQRVACFRLDAANANSPYVPTKVGIYAAAAHLGWFSNVYKAAFTDSNKFAIEFGAFKNRASMPKGGHPRFTQPEFDIVAEWFARGLPKLDTFVAASSAPATCTSNITPELQAYVDGRATTGWRQVNKDAGLNMFGCAAGQTGKACLTSVPDAASKSYGTTWSSAVPGTKVRVLRELSFNTYYWMRSSPDGRFVANGDSTNSAGAMISDLQRGVDIPTTAAYDPGFFPNNKGFVFQGTPIGLAGCSMSLLTGNPSKINFSEAPCRSIDSVGLYQHLGTGLGGGDNAFINSNFESDNPGAGTTSDTSAGFGESSVMTIIPQVYNGTNYTSKPSVDVATPFEGDSVLSPSLGLAMTRMAGPGDKQIGYQIRRLNMVPNATSYSITAPIIATICVNGGKPAISFDERFAVVHHYNANKSADLKLIDLRTGVTTTITSMQAGQQAIFPHFRSDGWIYFLVRDQNSHKEYAAASDAAFKLAGQ